jgi:hypothetical protein
VIRALQAFAPEKPGALLQCQGDLAPGTAPPNEASSGQMVPLVSPAALYTQLSHFHRLFDPTLELARMKDEVERLEAARSGQRAPAHSPDLHDYHEPHRETLHHAMDREGGASVAGLSLFFSVI